jgi:hypothetical protein
MHKYTGQKIRWLGLWFVFTLVVMFVYAGVYDSYKEDFENIQGYEDATYYSCLMMFAVGSKEISPKTTKGRSIVISQVFIFWFLVLGFGILAVE